MPICKRIQLFSTVLFCITVVSNAQAHKDKLAVDKVKGDLSVMVLGSGGPMATANGRASAGYLVFIDGQAKILMDAGGGTYQRVAESGVDTKDLDIVLLSHLHIDHMGDLAPIVKTMYFHNRIANVATSPVSFPPGRTAPFHVYGPATNNAPFPPPPPLPHPLTPIDPSTPQYPSSSEFVDGHFDLNHGLERYLHVFAQVISGGVFAYDTHDVSPNWKSYTPETIVDKDGLVITAVGVNHGPVPALGFRIDYKGKSIVYSGDTSSVGGNMIELSRDADFLIYDTAITDTQPSSSPRDAVFFALHTTPSRMGEVATAANAKTLVLSHLTPNTEPNIPEVKDLIRAKGFTGKIKVAEDLQVYNLMMHKDHH